MTEDHEHALVPGTVPTTLFDAWFAPFSYWANWCSFYAEALHVAQVHPPHAGDPAEGDEAPVHIEDEEGLVA
jgi:hypothetical protein